MHCVLVDGFSKVAAAVRHHYFLAWLHGCTGFHYSLLAAHQLEDCVPLCSSLPIVSVAIEEKSPDLDKEVSLAILKLREAAIDELVQTLPRAKHFPSDMPMDVAKAAFDILMDENIVASDALLRDIIVLCVAETTGTGSRGAFDAGLEEVFGECMDTRWYSRLHNSVYKVLRMNGIPVFPKKRRRCGRGKVCASGTACGSGQTSEPASSVPTSGIATVLWLGGPEC